MFFNIMLWGGGVLGVPEIGVGSAKAGISGGYTVGKSAY